MRKQAPLSNGSKKRSFSEGLMLPFVRGEKNEVFRGVSYDSKQFYSF